MKDYPKSFLEEYSNSRLVMMVQSPHSQDVRLSFFHNRCSHSEATRLEQHILERRALLDGALCKVVDLHEALASHATSGKLEFMLQMGRTSFAWAICLLQQRRREVRFWHCHLAAACGLS